MIVAAALIAAATLVASSAYAKSSFTRGIGIGHILGWTPLDSGRKTEFVRATFSDPARTISRDELAVLKREGFDFIRLVVDPGPFLRLEGSPRDVIDRMLLGHVRAILDADLSVVVDIHPSDLHSDYTGEALTAGRETRLFASYLNLLRRLSEQLAPIAPGRVALELLNEPPVPTSRWQRLLEAAYTAVRAQAPTLPVILSGGDEGSIDGLLSLKVDAFRSDPNALLSFHYYDPYQFTHQGASWNPAKYLANVPYPANARPMDEATEASIRLIDQAGLRDADAKRARADALNRLASYERSGFGRDAIAQAIARVAQWAHEHGIPSDRIILGEFGSVETGWQTANPGAVERQSWFRDVREAAERNSFGWATWVYRDGGFSLTPPGSTQIDPEVLRALGLTGQPSDGPK